MRFSIILISLALLPLMMIVHGWIFTEQQLPRLREQALEALQKNGIRSAVADVRYLDLRIAGNAADVASLEKARSAVAALGPIRTVTDELSIPAGVRARLDGETLSLEGWLPDEANVREAVQLLGKLRPDLSLQTEGLKADTRVRWPEGEKGPLTVDSSLLLPIVEKLRVSPWLEIIRDTEGLHIQGLLSANGARSLLLSELKPEEAGDLLESTHTLPAAFADPAVLLPFVKGFFAHPTPRRFFINEEDGPLIEAPATRTLESEWLALLRPVTGGRRVTLNLTFYPSEFHFPHYQPGTPLAGEQLKTLSEALTGQLISFSERSTSLSSEEQARLAALTPLLLTAGPALRLVIGGHPDPDGNPVAEKNLARVRAEQVGSFLTEQGLPTSDVQTMAFDSVPAGTPGAPVQTRSVEILIR